MLALECAIVTIDAMETQKDIAAAIIAKKADYVLALKACAPTVNHPTLLSGCALRHRRLAEKFRKKFTLLVGQAGRRPS